MELISIIDTKQAIEIATWMLHSGSMARGCKIAKFRSSITNNPCKEFKVVVRPKNYFQRLSRQNPLNPTMCIPEAIVVVDDIDIVYAKSKWNNIKE